MKRLKREKCKKQKKDKKQTKKNKEKDFILSQDLYVMRGSLKLAFIPTFRPEFENLKKCNPRSL